MNKSAKISPCERYRYTLWRTWKPFSDYVAFIGLNPSTADDKDDDPTIRRCINYAKDWGYGGLCMLNLFAYRATEPANMKAYHWPIGVDNDEWLQKLCNPKNGCSVVVAAWGNDGIYKNRATEVRALIPNLHYLKLNKSGEPAHPLYLKKDLKPIRREKT